MGILTRNRRSESEGVTDNAQFMAMVNQLRETNGMLADDNDNLRESMEDLRRTVDDMGWVRLYGMGTDTTEDGLSLDNLRKLLTHTRSLVAANPLVRKGVGARVGLIWGEGITVTGNRTKRIIDANARTVFNSAAEEEIEKAVSTDGNVFFKLDRSTLKISRVPLSRVSDFITDPDDNESVQFVKLVWSSRELSLADNKVVTRQHKSWYPTVEYVAEGGVIPAAIESIPVEVDQAINVVSVNKQVGWVWGVPDLLSVMFWSRAYKEFLESEYTLVRALARFAFKVTDTRPKGQGAKGAAVTVAQPREGIDAGGTVGLGGGLDMIAINKAGANVSFDAGRPLAAMVAAGLEIPLSILLAEPKQSTNNYEISLDPSTVKSAQGRQKLWKNELERMFAYLGARTAKVEFPPIQSAPIHRVIQSIVTAASTGGLHPSEVRELLVKALSDYGLNPKAGLPKAGEWAAFTQGLNIDNPGTSPLNTPDNTDPTNRSPAGALADGDHEMRPSE